MERQRDFTPGDRVFTPDGDAVGVVVGPSELATHVLVEVDGIKWTAPRSSLRLVSPRGLPVSQLKPGHLYTDLVSGLPVLVVDQESTPDKNKFALIKYFHNGEYKSALAVDGQLEERR